MQVYLDSSTKAGHWEVEGLETILRNWHKKSDAAKKCTVVVPAGENDFAGLVEKKVAELDESFGVAVTCESGGPFDPDPSTHAEGYAQKQSHLKDLILLASVDGRFDPEEEQMILDIGAKMGISARQVNSIYNQCVLNPDQIKSVVPETEAEKLRYLADLCRLILADGVIADWESVLIVPLAAKLGFDYRDVVDMLEEVNQ